MDVHGRRNRARRRWGITYILIGKHLSFLGQSLHVKIKLRRFLSWRRHRCARHRRHHLYPDRCGGRCNNLVSSFSDSVGTAAVDFRCEAPRLPFLLCTQPVQGAAACNLCDAYVLAVLTLVVLLAQASTSWAFK